MRLLSLHSSSFWSCVTPGECGGGCGVPLGFTRASVVSALGSAAFGPGDGGTGFAGCAFGFGVPTFSAGRAVGGVLAPVGGS